MGAVVPSPQFTLYYIYSPSNYMYMYVYIIRDAYSYSCIWCPQSNNIMPIYRFNSQSGAKQELKQRILRAKRHIQTIPITRDGEMPKTPLLSLHITFTQEHLREFIFHHPINIMHKNIRLPTIPPVSSHHPGRVDRRHPPGRLVVVPGGGVHHDQVPRDLVNQARQTFQCQLAHGVSGVVCSGRAFWSLAGLQQVRGLAEFSVVGDMVRFQHGELLGDLVNPGLVLFQEHCPAPIVEGVPHQAVVPEAEN